MMLNISQHIRFARVSSHVDDFNTRIGGILTLCLNIMSD